MTHNLIIVLLLIAMTGCAHVYDGFDWREVKKVDVVTITKVEREDAAEYCSKLYGKPTLACVDPGTSWENCKIVVPPNSPATIGHESVHCFGYIHP